MSSVISSAPGFTSAHPAQASQMTVTRWEYQVPEGDTQGSATFPASFQALEAPLVRFEEAEATARSRPAPRLGIARSTYGRASDVDEDKGAPFRGPSV
jgi:hypothetical protein